MRHSRKFTKDEMSKIREVFNNIVFTCWKLKKVQVIQLLSHEEELIIISRVISVYHSLKILFNNTAQAHAWIHKANRDFNNQSALELILSNQSGLKHVQQYLKGYSR